MDHPAKSKSVSDIHSESWRIFTKNWQLIAGLASLPLLLDFLLLGFVFPDLQDLFVGQRQIDSFNQFSAQFVPYALISFLLGVMLSGALILALLKVVRGQTIEFSKALSQGIERFWELLSVSTVIAVAIIMGVILLILPGLVAGFLLMFAVHARLDKQLSVGESLKLSYRLASKNVRRSLVLLLGFIGIAVGVSVLTGVLVGTQSNLYSNLVSSLLAIPMSAYLSTTFTVAYVTFLDSTKHEKATGGKPKKGLEENA